jgi:hypothetical protein
MNASCPIQIVAAVELVWTRDLIREHADGSQGTYPVPPPGEVWSIADFGKETRTQWQRPVVAFLEEG